MPTIKAHLKNTRKALKCMVKDKYIFKFTKIKLNQTIRDWCLAWLGERLGLNPSKQEIKCTYVLQRLYWGNMCSTPSKVT